MSPGTFCSTPRARVRLRTGHRRGLTPASCGIAALRCAFFARGLRAFRTAFALSIHTNTLAMTLLPWVLALCITVYNTRAKASHQVPFSSSSSSDDAHTHTNTNTPYTHLSYHGLQVNAPSNHPPPEYLTLNMIPSEELDASTARLYFSSANTRGWNDVMLGCGSDQGGIDTCQGDDMDARISRGAECRAVQSTMDGRALFDPDADGCETLALLWRQAYSSRRPLGEDIQEQLLSFKATLEIDYVSTSLHNDTHTQDFWLAHLQKKRALWPISNRGWTQGNDDEDDEDDTDTAPQWDGIEPNKISGLMEDPYFQRATKPNRTDPLNGIDLSSARWNLGVSLRLPPPKGHKSTLLPVHAPVGGQVIHIDLYRRHNAPSSLNDEQGWVISIRDEWGFVWSLFGISPYHQHVWLGQNIPQGHIIGHVSLRPLSPTPRDQNAPSDPPEKPPGGDGNPSYPFRFRELRIGVARPGHEWTEWRGPYEDGWQWYNPLLLLGGGGDGKGSTTIPPLPSPEYIFFARPAGKDSDSPAGLPEVFASVSTSAGKRPVNGDDDEDEDDIVTLDGDVEIIIGVRSFVQPTSTDTNALAGLDPVGIYKLEWALKQVHDVARIEQTTCQSTLFKGAPWRTAFEHNRLPHAWTSQNTPQKHPNSPSILYSHFLPAFTTGNFPWTKKKYATQFDEKSRGTVFYPFTRTLSTIPHPKKPSFGFWHTKWENRNGRVTGRGDFVLAVRFWDYWGNHACVTAKVRLRN